MQIRSLHIVQKLMDYDHQACLPSEFMKAHSSFVVLAFHNIIGKTPCGNACLNPYLLQLRARHVISYFSLECHFNVKSSLAQIQHVPFFPPSPFNFMGRRINGLVIEVPYFRYILFLSYSNKPISTCVYSCMVVCYIWHLKLGTSQFH